MFTSRMAWICALFLTLVGARGAQAQTVRVQTVVAGMSNPVYVTHANDARLFIVEQGGRIRIFDTATNTLVATPFLDISSKVSAGSERGLFSVAFHPDFAQNRYFFVDYTNLDGHTVIERYQVLSGSPNVADPLSARQLLLIQQPFANHNGGQIQIGTDGHLYLGMGDGGGSDPTCNSQTRNTLLGKMLRLDVRANLNVAPYYGIPSDNPFRAANDPSNAIPDEIWAFGFRNPWRFSFDRANGNLWIADVGQNVWEEINLHRAGSAAGKNFGWRVMEGNHCYEDPNGCPTYAPTCGSAGFTAPIYEYAHGTGNCSITGGYVSRGPNAQQLAGRYIYGDFCSGIIWSLRETSPNVFQNTQLIDMTVNVTSFGEGNTGRLFFTGGGNVYELLTDPVAAAAVSATPSWLLVVLALGLMALGWALIRSRVLPSLAR